MMRRKIASLSVCDITAIHIASLLHVLLPGYCPCLYSVLNKCSYLEMVQITNEQIDEFHKNGAICLRNVFSNEWIKKIEEGIETNQKNPSSYSESLVAQGGSGIYFNDYCNWQTITELKDFVYNSEAAEISGKLMNTKYAVFYHEHVLTKEPGTFKETPWHQDQPYYPIDGDKNCSIWVPVDPVPLSTTLHFVKGSHLWNKWYIPRKFETENNYKVERSLTSGDRTYENVPDIEGQLDQYEVLKWDVQPGDCIVFHMRTLHAAPGNHLDIPRRVLSSRWLGDDAVFADRPWESISPPITGGLKPGDPFMGDCFPIIWRQSDN